MVLAGGMKISRRPRTNKYANCSLWLPRKIRLLRQDAKEERINLLFPYVQPAIALDKSIGRAVMGWSGLSSALKFRDDPVCQYFAEFDAPLVERIDVPDCALDKNLMLIECNQLAQYLRCQPCGEDGICWAIPLKSTVWNLE